MRRSFKHIHFPSYRPSFSNISIRKNQEGKFSSDSNKYHYDTPNISPYADFSFNTLSELQSKACTLYESNPMLGTKSIDNKSFEWLTYGDFGRKVEKFRGVLRDLNVGYGDKVAIISNNRTEWAISMYATVSIGGQFVPMYEAQLEKDWRYIIEDSGAKLLIVANDSIFAKVQSYQGSVGAPIQNILVLDCDADKEHSFHRLMASSAMPKSSTLAYEKLQSSDIATIIYTSGTTGNPKGVELTHGNIASDVMGVKFLWKENLKSNTSLAFLPWAHVFGLTSELHSLVSTGSALAIVPSREQILECLPLVRPTIILSVPALFNKVYDGVMKTVNSGSVLKKWLFLQALAVSRRRNHLLEMGQQVGPLLAFQHRLADRIVFSKVRDKLGGRLKYMASGGAAVSLKVLHFFEDIGIPIMEGYGLTETSPMITASSLEWKNRRLGTVGVCLEGQEVQIVDPITLQPVEGMGQEGEITCSGPNVMRGYHNNEKANQEVFFTLHGKRFFRTGDLGKLVDGRFLQVTGRIKEQFKLENGKYVVPATVEDTLGRSPMLAQIFLYGDNKPYTVALLVLNQQELKIWANRKGGGVIPEDEIAYLKWTEQTEVREMLIAEITEAGKGLKSYERPQNFKVLFHAFSQENQMLTPKMSLRRAGILRTYKSEIEGLYPSKR